MMRRIAGVLLLCWVGVVAGCRSQHAAPRTVVIVRGGPLLRDAFPKAVADFQALHPEVDLRSDFSCPPCLLTTRMSQGLEMDVFISAGNVERDTFQQSGD